MKDIDEFGVINQYTQLKPSSIVFYKYDSVVNWLRKQLKYPDSEETKPQLWIGKRIARRIKNLFRREGKEIEREK